MNTVDFSPFFRRSVGFDRLFRMIDDSNHHSHHSYPPYNIEQLSEDRYRISLAIAGFAADDVTIETKESQLCVIGRKEKSGPDIEQASQTVESKDGFDEMPEFVKRDCLDVHTRGDDRGRRGGHHGAHHERMKAHGGNDRRFLHQGIAERSFERRFSLDDHIRVEGAQLENGLLHISLIREIPEAMKPRTVPITSAHSSGKVKSKSINDVRAVEK